MPKKIDWLYHRKGCATCKKAEGYRDSAGTPVAEVVDAGKTKFGPAEALGLLAGVEKIVAAKGKKIDTIDLKKAPPGDEAVLALIMGPTGNLRAPTARVGKTLLVGFNEEAYEQILG